MADFGLASEGTSQGNLTTKFGRGTEGYRAPEVVMAIEDSGTFNNKVDIWAMGCILYELVLGHQVFRSDGATIEHYYTKSVIEVPCSHIFTDDGKVAICAAIEEMMQNDPRLRPAASDLVKRFASLSKPGQVLPSILSTLLIV